MRLHRRPAAPLRQRNRRAPDIRWIELTRIPPVAATRPEQQRSEAMCNQSSLTSSCPTTLEPHGLAGGPEFAPPFPTAEKSWTRENAVMIRAGIILVAALVLTPAALTMGRSWFSAGEAVTRPVTLEGPIVGFRQERGQIEVRLDASAARPDSGAMRVSVADASDPDVEPLNISLRRGQTFANAKLPDRLTDAGRLTVTVEQVQTLARN